MKIGLIKEGKSPIDRRVAFSPKQLSYLHIYYENRIIFKVAPSSIRCFTNEEYDNKGIEVSKDLSDCDILFGIKEVPLSDLLPGKTYFFFSHTVKKQIRNRRLLQEIIRKNIRLIDYEMLKGQDGQRVVGFGKWAGIVGAYNGFWTYGMKSGLYTMKRAYECFDKQELFGELKKVDLPPVKIVLTGDGRVASGALEILNELGIRKVSPEEFIRRYFDEPVFAQLKVENYNQRKKDGGFDREEFYAYPNKYEGCFLPYSEVSDLLIAAAYWDPKAPKLFEMEDINKDDFNISVIADITCDIEGSIPTTIKASSIADPVYDIDRNTYRELPAFGRQNSISVMAIDNLPCELPRDASEDFGSQLIGVVIPELLKNHSKMLQEATITENGKLTETYGYLQDFVSQEEGV